MITGSDSLGHLALGSRRLVALALVSLATSGCFDPSTDEPDGSGTDSDMGTSSTTSIGTTTATTTTDATSTTGDDSTSTTSIPTDPTSDGSSTGEPEVVEAAFIGTPDYIGFPTTVDASTSVFDDGGTVEWTIDSVPTDSTITTADLDDATALQASFMPDLGGDYTLTVTVTGADGMTMDTATETVTVPTYLIPFVEVAGSATSSSRAPTVVRSDGTDNENVGCVITQDQTSTSSWLSDFESTGLFTVGVSVPNSSADAPRIAYAPDSDLDSLLLADDQSDCLGNQPVSTPVGNLFPRFSPSGDRVVAFDQFETSIMGNPTTVERVVSFSVAGNDVRVIREPDTSSISMISSAPMWTADDRVLWTESDSTADTITVYSTIDAQDGFSNALQQVMHMQCDTNNADHAEALVGVVLTANNGLVAAADSGDPTHLWQFSLTNDGETFDCDLTNSTLNRMISPVDGARDHVVSPDGSFVVFSSPSEAMDAPDEAFNLMRARLDAVEAPTLVFGNDIAANTGPKFALDGRQLYWTSVVWEEVTEDMTTFDRPATSRILMANSDGSGGVRALYEFGSSNTETRYLTSGRNTCAVSPDGRAPSLFLLGLLGLGWSRRRRNR